MDTSTAIKLIRRKAIELGFSHMGITQALEMTEAQSKLKKWLSKGFHGEMTYMTNYFEKRVDPSKLVPGAQSVICLAYNYYSEKNVDSTDGYKISRYAYGKDYHFVVKDKLRLLTEFINAQIAPFKGRFFVDSAPVLERALARESGLGWIGKNTMVITPGMGSYFFLSEIILDLKLIYDEPISDYCGTCSRCIDACPTEAIAEEGYEMDGSKCISYLTIEYKGEIDDQFKSKMNDWIFGCDICQEVCPWNRFSTSNNESYFDPHPDLLKMTKLEWESLTPERFKELFAKSAVKRTSYNGLKRNISFAKTP